MFVTFAHANDKPSLFRTESFGFLFINQHNSRCLPISFVFDSLDGLVALENAENEVDCI